MAVIRVVTKSSATASGMAKSSFLPIEGSPRQLPVRKLYHFTQGDANREYVAEKLHRARPTTTNRLRIAQSVAYR